MIHKPSGFYSGLLTLLCLSSTVVAQHRKLPATMNTAYEKNFRLLYELENLNLNNKSDTVYFSTSPASTPGDSIRSTRFSPAYTDQTANELLQLLKKSGRLNQLTGKLKLTGFYKRFEDKGPDSLFLLAFKQDIAGLNNIISTYTTNKGFVYPKIDSASYAVNSKYYEGVMREMLIIENQLQKNNRYNFQTLLYMALQLLTVNNRDEAGRHEPLQQINAATLAKVKSTYQPFPYSAILLLGEGPENNLRISANSKLRCELAARLFFEKKAPCIIISGGYVHPFQTAYAEGVELKNYLAKEWGVPANCLVMEPHARHTTTNLRNASRILLEAGISPLKPILCVSSGSHIDFLFNPRFAKTATTAFGYVPFEKIERISTTEAAFWPTKLSLHRSSIDPLDP